jgi:hypothetical protein
MIYFGLIFWLLPFGLAWAFIGVQLAVFGLYMGATFAPNHNGMPIVPADVKLDFLSKPVRTSRNIAGGWWATILMGGLNYQIEHHLFPSSRDRICACLRPGAPPQQRCPVRRDQRALLLADGSSATSTASGSLQAMEVIGWGRTIEPIPRSDAP